MQDRRNFRHAIGAAALTVALAVGGGGLGVSTAVFAQSGELPVQDNAELVAFVDALRDVHNIQVRASNEMSGAETNQQVESIQQDAQAEMMQAIEDTGLSVPRFNELMADLQTNQTFQQRVEEELPR